MKKSLPLIKPEFLNLYFLIFAFLTISISSAQDPLKLIPSNASGITTMNGEVFFKKIDLNQINRLEMFQDMDEQTQGKKGNKYKEYSKIYKDPASIGLNIFSKSYLYFYNSKDTSQWGMPYTFTGIVMPLLKGKKFESFIKKVSDSTIIKHGAYKYSMTGTSSLIAWNSSQVIHLSISGYQEGRKILLLEEFSRVINLPTEKCIRVNKNFMSTQNQVSDFNYWMNFDSYMNELVPMTRMYLPIFKDLPFIGSEFYKEYYLQMNLHFKKGEIAMDAKQFLSEESGAKIKNLYGKSINPEFMKYLHKDHLLGVCSYALNMKEIKNMLDTTLADSVKVKLNEGFVGLLYENKIKNDSKVKKLQGQVDSMYTDLYPASNYDYTTADTAVSYDSYLEEVVVDTAAYYNPEADTVQVDSASIEEVYYDTYNYAAEDSIYNAKNERIEKTNKEIADRKKVLIEKKIKEMNLSKDFLFDLFKGDAIGAITDLYLKDIKYISYEYDSDLTPIEVEKTRKDPYPEFLVGFTLNNVTEANKFIKQLTKDSFLLKQNNYYQLAGELPVNVFVVITNNLLLITNDEQLLKNNLNGYASEDRISKELQTILLDKTSSGYVNLKDIFLRLPNEDISPNTKATYDILINSLRTTSFTSSQYDKNVSSSDFDIQFANKIDNSFYEIFRIANEIYKLNRQSY